MRRTAWLAVIALGGFLSGCNLFGQLCHSQSDCPNNETCEEFPAPCATCQAFSVCIPNGSDGGTTDGGPICDPLVCDGGTHWDSSQCRCVTDGSDGGICPDNVLCLQGSHWDSQACRCEPDPQVCVNDQQCPPGEVCTGGEPIICPPNADCAPLRTCQPAPVICQTDQDCPAGDVCEGEPFPCPSNAACDPIRTCRPACVQPVDVFCPLDSSWDSNRCGCAPPPTPCNCGPGSICVQQVGGPAVQPGWVPPWHCEPVPTPCNGCGCLQPANGRCAVSNDSPNICVCDNGMR